MTLAPTNMCLQNDALVGNALLAVELLSMGVNIKVVHEILGHSQVSMTLSIYSHVLPGMQEEAMGKMNDLFRKRRDDKDEAAK